MQISQRVCDVCGYSEDSRTTPAKVQFRDYNEFIDTKPLAVPNLSYESRIRVVAKLDLCDECFDQLMQRLKGAYASFMDARHVVTVQP